jgi:hypothetical protein
VICFFSPCFKIAVEKSALIKFVDGIYVVPVVPVMPPCPDDVQLTEPEIVLAKTIVQVKSFVPPLYIAVSQPVLAAGDPRPPQLMITVPVSPVVPSKSMLRVSLTQATAVIRAELTF